MVQKSTARTDDAAPTVVVEEEVSAEVAKRRAALLEGDAEARELYERLVVSGVVTAREFWHSREVHPRFSVPPWASNPLATADLLPFVCVVSKCAIAKPSVFPNGRARRKQRPKVRRHCAP